MTEKPDVLSDYQIEDIVQDPREVYGAGLVAQAQRDAIIKEFSEAIESWQRRLEQARQDTAREIHDFLQMHLYARPDKPTATMKFTDWVKLRELFAKYGVK